ncbi:unnamed protein product, partial [Allacma fusca]
REQFVWRRETGFELGSSSMGRRLAFVLQSQIATT